MDPQALLALSRDELWPFERALDREWIEVDGRGGYASSTVVMCPTRRYHGLLVATPPGHDRKHVFLSRFEETLQRPEREFPLSTARYPGVWSPTGHATMVAFSLVPYPRFVYRLGRTTVTREILLIAEQSVVLSRYRLDSVHDDIELRLRPLLAFREADQLTFENLHLRTKVERKAGGIRVQPYPELPPLEFRVVGAEAQFEADPTWYRDLEYQADLARGYDGHEDQYCPGWFSAPLLPGQDVIVAAGLGEAPADPARLWRDEAARREERMQGCGDTLACRLKVAAGAYPYRARDGRLGVLSGFPWYGESARATCVALPGIGLARGDVGFCGEALEGLVGHLRKGLMPSRLGPTVEESQYDTADGALWFARAVHLYDRAGGDPDAIRKTLRPALLEIAERYIAGTDLGIGVDDQGLLHAGGENLAVTWMDARVDGKPVTPRDGYPVELNALWYHLLAYLELLAEGAGETADRKRWQKLRRKAKRAFVERFVVPGGLGLADVWKNGVQDTAIRPNMVIAASLELSPLTRGQRTDIVACARGELLTPVGLRTLSPKNPAYLGRCTGDEAAREAAAHQGSVWPWLLGSFAEAWLRAYGFKAKRIQFLRDLLDHFRPNLSEAGLLHVSEVFDGDPPHHPGGAVALACSVSELLRVERMLEDRRL